MRPLTAFDHGLVVAWPWASNEEEADAELTPRRRRRITPLQRWMPTILFTGTLLGVILALILVQATLLSPQPAPLPAAPPDLPPLESTKISRAPVEPQAPAAPPALRFTLQVIEPSYTVAQGDTLSTIAQRYNVTVAALRGINDLPDGVILRVGQRLVIP